MSRAIGLILLLLHAWQPTSGQAPPPLEGSVPAFPIKRTDIGLQQTARPGTYFDRTGRRFAILGEESGSFEAWAWPLKLFRDFRLSFFIGESTTPIAARDVVQTIRVEPHATSITYVYQSFTVRAHYVAHPARPGGMVLLDVDSNVPLRIVAGFIPAMEPMWPAGLGGQYAFWDGELRAYLISESSRRNHGYLGSPSAAGLSYTPAHMLSEQPNEFAIAIDDPARLNGRFLVIGMAGGPGDRSEVRTVYEEIVRDPEAVYRAAVDHARGLLDSSIRVVTPDPVVNRALAWAIISYDGLMVDNPHFEGPGLTAGLDRAGRGGRPGFGWFFGGDTYINSLSLDALGNYATVREAIAFTEAFQRDDGKMPHEITQATEYVDWFGRYGYAYIHADTSPYFIAAVYDHFLWTADSSWVRDRWPALRRAYGWSRDTDGNGDGLMDNSLAGLGALEFGSLTGIETDIYLGAVWVRATDAMRSLARVAGDDEMAQLADGDFERARPAFEKFWNDGIGQYSYGFSEDGQTVSEVTPWAAVGLMWGYGQDSRARSTLARMAAADMTTDWGVRMMSTTSAYFEPLNYNYGAVWPFLTSWVATAQYNRGLPLRAYSTWRTAVGHVERRALGHVTEVLSGAAHTWPQESVPHQGFCTAATVLPFFRGLLGIEPNAPAGTLSLRPKLPVDWSVVTVDNLQVGTGTYSLRFEQPREGLLKIRILRSGGAPARVRLEPFLPPRSRVLDVQLGERDLSFESRYTPEATIVPLDIPVDTVAEVVVTYEPGFSIVAPNWETEIGDTNRGLHITRFDASNASATDVLFEGLSGESYEVQVTGSTRVESIETDGDVELEGDRLRLRFASGEPGYLTTAVRFVTKSPE